MAASPTAENVDLPAAVDSDSDFDDDVLLLDTLVRNIPTPASDPTPMTDTGAPKETMAFSGRHRFPSEKYSGLRLKSREVDEVQMDLSMEVRRFVKLENLNVNVLKSMMTTKEICARWCTIGVLMQKVDRKTVDGRPYRIWTLTDLRHEASQVSIFLYGNAGSDRCLGAIPLGSVMIVAGASGQFGKDDDDKENDSFTLKVNLEQQFTLLGMSAEYARCGQGGCYAVINSSFGGFCNRHMSEQYERACNSRMSLQSTVIKANKSSINSKPKMVRNLSQGTFNINARQLTELQRLALRNSAHENCKKRKDSSSSSTANFPLAEQLKQRKKEATKLKSKIGETAVILADGTLVSNVSSSTSKLTKGNKSDPVSARSKVFVNALNNKMVQGGGMGTMAKTLSRGTRAFFSGCTGFNLDNQSRLETNAKHREIERELQGRQNAVSAAALAAQRTKDKALRKEKRKRDRTESVLNEAAKTDVVARALLSQKRQKCKQRFETASTHLGIGPPPPSMCAAQQERVENLRYAANTKAAYGEKLAIAQRNAQRSGTGVVSFDMAVVARRARENEAMQRSVILRGDAEKRQAEQKRQEQSRKRADVAAKLKTEKNKEVPAQRDRMRLLAVKKATKKSGVVTSNIQSSAEKKIALVLNNPKAITQTLKERMGAHSRALLVPSKMISGAGATNVRQALGKKIDANIDLSKALDRSSRFGDTAEADADLRLQHKLHNLVQAEESSNRLAEVTELKVKVYFCHECEKQYEQRLSRCVEEAHEFSELKTTKRFFRCLGKGCHEKTYVLGKKKCHKSCPACRGIKWEPASAYSDRTLGISQAPKTSKMTLVQDDANCSTAFNRRSYN